ncbi:hypothetical protein K469DRAFT_615320 [Zopfia rhizophila CBS 207.26]|uniref:Zn(2)-C6 fungal-type domain-containing protein n=1 Tax=Zopfia rhizophila CBS 207.26 TaxID=1314779 RepID=A0A6A6EUW4_9PEZI|nr:hypothetical protein K469DRAFT_615320 [Zopfia rhizophila CBS 207.26]
MNTRRWTPKTRTGCLTCKARRVKCDEARPSCARCIWGGRKCAGYSSIFRSNKTAVPVSASSEELLMAHRSPDCQMSPTMSLTTDSFESRPPNHQKNRRSFTYFIDRTSLELSGPLDADFWGSYVLSLSSSSTAVYHALIALGAMHEELRSNTHVLPNTPFALQHYLTSVRTLNEHLSISSSISASLLEEILVACTLFICAEVLLCDYSKALMHLNGGLQAIYYHGVDAGHQTRLKEVFIRLDSQALGYAGGRPSQWNPAIAAPSAQGEPIGNIIGSELRIDGLLRALQQARAALQHHLRAAQHFLRENARQYKYHLDTPTEVLQERDQQLCFLDLWKANVYDILIHSPISRHESYAATSLAHLLMAYIAYRIRLLVCLEPLETAYGAYVFHFNDILRAAERLHACDPCIPFTLESTTVEHLYFTVLKCRNRNIRHRALQLLREAGRQGVWYGPAMASIGCTVIEFEEGGPPSTESSFNTKAREGPAQNSPVDLDPSAIPESRMVHGTSIEWDQTRRRIDITCSRWAVDRWVFEEAVASY